MNTASIIQEPGVESLLEVLHQERRVLERLMFRLSEAGMLVAVNEHRYLALAMDEVAELERELGQVEILRAILVAGIAENWGLPDLDLPLTGIASRAPDYAEALDREQADLRSLVEEISALKETIAERSRKRMQSTREALQRLATGGMGGAYAEDGGPVRSSPSRTGFSAEL